MPSQGKIIDSLNRYLATTKVNLTLNNNGICGGVVVLYLLEKAAQREPQFFAKLKKMSRLKRTEYAAEASFVSEFCRNVELCFEPHVYQQDVRQGNLDKILQMFGKSVKKKYQLGLSANKAKFCEICTDAIKEEELIYLSANQHAVGLYKKGGKFYTYDPNGDEDHDVIADSVEQLYDQLREYFFYETNDTSNLDLEIFIFSNPNLSPAEQLQGTYPDKKAIVANLFNKDLNAQDAQYKKALNTSLALSCKGNDFEMVGDLINRGADPFEPYQAGKHSPFKLACMIGALDVVIKILRLENPTPTDALLKECLEMSVLYGQTKIFFELMSSGIQYDFNKPNNNGDTLIHLAAHAYHPDMLKTMLAISPAFNVLSVNNDHQTPLLIAASEGREKHVTVLLANQEVLDNKAGLIEACKAAAKAGSWSIVKKLLTHVSAQEIGLDLLENAAENGHEILIAELLNCGIKPTLELVKKILLKCKLNIIETIFRRCDETLFNSFEYQLFTSILERNKIKLALLMSQQKTFDASTLSNFPPSRIIQLIVTVGADDMLNSILRYDAFRDAIKAINSQLLIKSCQLGHVQCAATLIKHGATVVDQKEQMRQLLRDACKKGDFEVVSAVMIAGFDPLSVTTVDEITCSFVELTYLSNYPDVVAELLKFSSLSKLSEDLYKKLVRYASKNGHLDILKALMPQVIASNNPVYLSEFYRALEDSLTAKQAETTCYLLNNGFNPNNNNDKESLAKLIVKSIWYGQITVLNTLIKITGCRLSDQIVIKNKTYYLFEEALKNKQADMVLYLLNSGVEPKTHNENMINALTLACKNGFVEVTKQLRIKMPNITIEKNNVREIFLNACKTDNLNVINALIAAGFDVKDAQNLPLMIEGLFAAIEQGYKQIVVELIKLGASLKSNHNGKTTLQIACEKGQKNIVNYILQESAVKPINGDADFFQTLRHIYLSRNVPVSIEQQCYDLLQHTFELGHHAVYEWVFNQKDHLERLKKGQHPKGAINTSIAYLNQFETMKEKVEVARHHRLLVNVINDIKDKNNPIQNNLQNENNGTQTQGIQRLPDNSGNVSVDGRLSLFEKSLNFPCPPSLKSFNVNHPNPHVLLDYASKQGKANVVVKLLENGANLSKAKLSGFEILARACLYGDFKVVQQLLNRNIDFINNHALISNQTDNKKIDQLDTESHVPIKIAAAFGHHQIVALLINKYVEKNAQKNKDAVLDELINIAIKDKNWYLFAAILESMPYKSLNEQAIKKYQPFRYEIRDAFIASMKDIDKEDDYRNDASMRLNNLTGPNNALGQLLQTPVSQIRFLFTTTEDGLGNKITKSIAKIHEEVAKVNDQHRKLSISSLNSVNKVSEPQAVAKLNINLAP